MSKHSLTVKVELRGSFHDAIGLILMVAQFFALMPVDEVNAKDISNINFRWNSLKTIYSLIFLICGAIECLLCFRLIFRSGTTSGYLSSLTFYVISMVSAFFIFRLATKWKKLMKLWFDSEKVFLKFPYAIYGLTLKQRIWLWGALIGFLIML